MAVVSKSALKTFFETGDVPTQSNFEDLIDSCYNEAGSGGFYWHRFVPDTINSWVSLLDGNITRFSTLSTYQWYSMCIPIPYGVTTVKLIRLIGASYLGIFNTMRLVYHADFLENSLSPVTEFPGYKYTLFEQQVPLTSPDFDIQIPLNIGLNYTTYRYFTLHLEAWSLPPTNWWSEGYIKLNPVGIEYE